jgi:UDP-glucose 4-epimerase
MRASPTSCLVLGGGGFLGTNLCRRLLLRGWRTGGFGLHCRFRADMPGLAWHAGDFRDQAALAAALPGYDVVFHLVHTTVPYSANLDVERDLAENVTPSLKLLDLCRDLGVKRVVFISSGGTVYGAAAQVPTPESAPTNPLTAYAVTKLAIEKYLALYENLYRLDYRVLRLANPFGPYQVPSKGQGVIGALLASARKGEPMPVWGDGSVVRDYVFVDDVIDAMEAAIVDQSGERIFNIGSGEGRSLREVIAAVEQAMGQPIAVRMSAGRPLDVPRSVLDSARARAVLGWTPKTSFADGLQRTVAWWRTGAGDN